MNELKEKPVDKKKFYDWIEEVLKGKIMTAYEVAVVLEQKGRIPLATRQAVQPRMTELKEKGVLAECGKKFDNNTSKYVTCYRIAN